MQNVVREFFIMQNYGLTLLSVTLLAKLASDFKSMVFIEHSGESYQATQVLDVLALGITQGDQFMVATKGTDAPDAMRAVQDWAHNCGVRTLLCRQ